MRIFSKLALATGGALVLSLGASVMVQAQDATTTTTPTPVEKSPAEQAKEARERAKLLREDAMKKVEEARKLAKETKATKLEDTKLRICKARESNVNKLMERISQRGDKHLQLVDKTLERVQKYKTDKSLTVANYEALLADAAAKKAAALAAVQAVKTGQVEFKCDGTDPKGAAAVFKELMTKQTEALKAYHASAIDLLKAVKQSQGASTPTTPTPPPATPTPATNTQGVN